MKFENAQILKIQPFPSPNPPFTRGTARPGLDACRCRSWRRTSRACMLLDNLVVACRQDRLRSFTETERMARHLPNTRFTILEDCGHMAPLERPHELTALLAGWIKETRLYGMS